MIALELNTKYSNYRIASIYARDKISNLNNWISNESSILYIKEDNETYKLFDELNIKIPIINTKESIMIKDIPLNERPREKAIINGVEVLSNEELISIILKSGTKNYSVKTLSNNILSSIININDLKNITLNRLIKINGIGRVKATTLLAALELGKRVYYTKDKEKVKLNNSKKIYEYFKDIFIFEKQENFYAIYLDSKSYLISYKLLFKGTLNTSCVHPREVFKYAFLESAYSIIIMHNHPSGDATPSIQDEEVTSSLFEIGKMVGISVVDHIIFGNNTYFSFYEYINSKKNNM